MTVTHFEYPTSPTPCASCRFASGHRGEGAMQTAECNHPLVAAEAERRKALPVPLRDTLHPLVTTVNINTIGSVRPCHAREEVLQ